MKTLTMLFAAAAATLAPAIPAHAYHHGYHHGGRVYVAPYYPRYYIPFSFSYAPFAAPYYAYPPVVERPYVLVPQPRPALREPAPPQYSQEERSYAQITPPPAPAPKPAPTPSRLERFTLSATELFEFDKATLRMPQPKLDEIAAVLNRDPSIERVTITGYTDRLGSEEYNLKLSQYRADAVKGYFMQKGVAEHRLHAVGKGESNPVVHCDDTDRARLIKCLEPNRRVEVEQITVEVRR